MDYANVHARVELLRRKLLVLTSRQRRQQMDDEAAQFVRVQTISKLRHRLAVLQDAVSALNRVGAARRLTCTETKSMRVALNDQIELGVVSTRTVDPSAQRRVSGAQLILTNKGTASSAECRPCAS